MTPPADGRSDRQPLKDILAGSHLGVLATLKRDGRPQLSDVSYQFDTAPGTIRVSITEGRAKTANLRRDPRASLHVRPRSNGGYAVAEGIAQLSRTAADPMDVTVESLVDLYRAIAGEHPDWDEYREAMVAERRIVLTILVDNIYGWNPQVG
ncbi:MAG: PPOX class F420-dependent oxidoreductase [Actinomycetota bacterium]|nr:PPOX class F420-dependent oxidoreductase [Actinomycetota bacterium]